MKKLVMLCAIVAAAASVHAASFTWGGAFAAEDGLTAIPAGTSVYLMYSDTAFGTISSFNTGTMTTDVGGTLVQTHTITDTETSSYVYSDTYSNSDYTQMNGYYATIMVSGSDMYYSTFQVTEFTSATTPLQDYQVNTDWSGAAFLGDPTYKGTVTGGGGGGGGGSGPEPTSGLLLLVGAGLLGLRRKRA